ncbi:hypothetical protein NQ315_016453 [Exocentrus adspersus]|uniref:5'-nucleotidase n=1 Tax=Exocentrus adspersus TaxID=1586481 RepID=A0AAV8W0H0_9CUCU|nr:hypothetical protein NQ315_016453 [Exocentrus adspersus]
MENYVKEINELNKNHVHIKDVDRVNKIIHGFISGGPNKLHVLSDFDKTITKQHENGKLHLTSFGMFNKYPSLPEEYLRTVNGLAEKYRPIEIDPTLSIKEKSNHMEEWWLLTEKALMGLEVNPMKIEEVCSEIAPSLRDGTKEFFNSLKDADIPVLVFSAGLGDTVVAVLKHSGVFLPNVEVVSNFLKYNNEGAVVGFKDRRIHCYNKNEFAIKGTEFYNKILNRNNVILLGDSIGDAGMTEGMDHLENVLKIGFLYERSQEFLPKYMSSFDIVLEDDQTMDVPRAILNYITTSPTHLGEK